MPVILCFGDSNTWGYDAEATAVSPVPARHAREVRWTGVLAARLGGGYSVIEEGQNGRTTVHEDPLSAASRNGREHLPVLLESHKPLDSVVVMLGTNDLKTLFNLPPQDIANGVGVLVKMILQSDAGAGGKAPRVLLVCPPAVGDLSALPDLAARFESARAKSLLLPRLFEAIATQSGAAFLNAQAFTTPSPIDGLHLDSASHRELGEAIAAAITATA